MIWFVAGMKVFNINPTSELAELGFVAERLTGFSSSSTKECCHGSTADAVQKPEAT